VPVAHHSVFAEEPIFEYDRSSHPFRNQLVHEPIGLVDGRVAIPTRPGLGIEIDRGTLERYRV
jgi:D-galactarolactone cycloisomerase